MRVRTLLFLVFACCIASTAPAQQTPAPQAAPTPSPGEIDVRMIRLKISAGDLPSAESILDHGIFARS